MPETATPEEILRVRKLECEHEGHDFEVIRNFAGPCAVVCTRCGCSMSEGPAFSKLARAELLSSEAETLRAQALSELELQANA